MSRYLGIAVSRTAIRAVALARGRVTWAAERPLGNPKDLGEALAELAAERPRGFRRARVVLAGDLVQVKLLDGLPRLSPARLRRAVALQAGRWFLMNGGPPATGAVRQDGGASALAAAGSPDTLAAVAQGLAAAGLQFDAAGTAAATCAALLPDGVHVLVADGIAERLVIEQGRLRALRRSTASATPMGDGPAVPGLEDGGRFFAAYAAAVTGPTPPLACGVSDAERVQSRRVLAMRVLVAALLLWGAAAGVFAARVHRAIGVSRGEVELLAQPLEAAVVVERDLALAEGALHTLRDAQTARSRDARLLAVLTRALPDSAFLVSVRRGREGRLHAVGSAPSAAAVLAALGGAPGVTAPSLQGGVTRELVRGTPRERFTVAFSWRPEASR